MTYIDAYDDLGTATPPPDYVKKPIKTTDMTKIKDPKTGKFISKPKPVK
jgi:hypothetical protein